MPSHSPEKHERPGWPETLATVLVGSLLVGMCGQTILADQSLAAHLMSRAAWEGWIRAFGATPAASDSGNLYADGDLLGVLLLGVLLGAAVWLAAAALQTWRDPARSFPGQLRRWGAYGFRWWFVPGLWGLLLTFAPLLGSPGLYAVLHVGLPFTLVVWLAGSVATWVALCDDATRAAAPSGTPVTGSRRTALALVVFAGAYVLIFTALNWQLYRNLQIPHGDSAMYEEHLWNLLHGKGFRSYLDQGLFLGEHIQVIHVLLLPLYLLWPSHLLLELCESLVLALAAWPIYRITLRNSESRGAALTLAAAYLLYPPMQFLDIAIDLKTFRPIAFGLAPLLFGIDALERRKYGCMAAWFLLTLSAKEDYAIVLACLGAWLFLTELLRWRRHRGESSETSASQAELWRGLIVGGALAVFSVGYLFLATRVLIPYFRSGEELHYVRYFSKFGESPGQIVWTMLTDPGLLIGELATANTLAYALALLVPLGLMPLFSPSRVLVAAPLFVLLALNEVITDPRHHVHAPLVPLLFWAAAHGMGEFRRRWGTIGARPVYAWVVTSALGASVLFGISPVSLTFWDSGSTWYWRNLYVVGERARQFAKIYPKIPKSWRVASTDFVHPRFTHHERSYDYSQYARKVSGYELTVPEDTDAIVIDTRHRYSEITRPEQIREYREHPERWTLWPDVTDGYFIVLERVRDSNDEP